MANTKTIKKNISAIQIIMTMACVVIVIAGLKLASSFFIPLLLAFFIATVSFPILKFLRDKGISRFIAVLVTVLVDFIVIGGVIVSLVASVGQLQNRWESEYSRKLYEKNQELREYSKDTLVRFGVEEEEASRRVNKFLSNDNLRDLLRGIEIKRWWDVSTSVILGVLAFAGNTFIVTLLTIFMLSEAKMFGRRMNSVFSARGPNFHRILSACRDIQKYLGIKTVVSALTGLLAYVLCLSLNVDFPELWGLLAFALNYIPAIGSVIAGIPPVLLALLIKDVQTAVLVAGGYIGINGLLGNFIEPMLLGNRFGISTLVVIISVLFWGWVWGPVGMLLGVPLTMLLKVALDNSNDFRWLAVAISKENAPSVADEKIIADSLAEDSAVEEAKPV